MRNDAIVRFEDVSFEFGAKKPILREVNFAVRRGSKITLMGQNGAGKSTIFKLITGEKKPDEGEIHRVHGLTIAIARQVIPREQMEISVQAFFERCFDTKVYDLDPRIEEVLETVNLEAPLDRTVKSFSGGQQARLLLASALIQNPDLLLLDEPTNNLDKAGIEHLTQFLVEYKKSCMVISHDADFLNAFTDSVLYLDVHTHIIEQYDGNYADVVRDIAARIEKENRKNAQFAKEIQANKEKANFFANKGGQMRLVAKRMREKAADMEEAKVDVRKEDRSIRTFTIPAQKDLSGTLLHLSSVNVIKNGKQKAKKCNVSLRKDQHLLIKGPNGIGKSTLLESIAGRTLEGMELDPQVRIGYYRQDFSTLDFDQTVYESLMSAMEKKIEQDMRSIAAGFLIDASIIHTPIGSLSEGQKGLVAFARLVLEKPGLLILDEPTNHMNFRHLPTIAAALDQFEGAMILVSHVPTFVEQIRIDEILDLEK